MNINSIPDIFQSKLRIAIVASLMTGTKTFKEIKALTQASDGNISTHMKKLSDSGHVEIFKDFKDNKPRTRYAVTQKGREEFTDYVNMLESIIKQV